MSNYLRQWRESRGLTLEQVGNGIGTDKTQVSKLERGDRRLSTDWLEKLARLYGVDTAKLLAPPPERGMSTESVQTLVSSPSVLQNAWSWARDVPILGVTVGGVDGSFQMNAGEVADYAKRPPTMDRAGRVFALYVQGSSMSRWREQGQLVYCDPVRPAKPGDRVVVECHPEREGDGHPAFLKELVAKTGTKLRLKQYNPEGIIEIPLARVKHIHRVVEWEELLGV